MRAPIRFDKIRCASVTRFQPQSPLNYFCSATPRDRTARSRQPERPPLPRQMLLLVAAAIVARPNVAAAIVARPNVLLLFADDWGWGDLGANWKATVGLTPHMDALAASGMRLTDFHAGASVCTPSRASLLTGRLGLRTGITHNFSPGSAFGLPRTELTIAALLKQQTDYHTAMIGKWHLGTTPGYAPTYHGFDEWFGLPYSDDMGCVDTAWPNLPVEPTCAKDSAMYPSAAPRRVMEEATAKDEEAEEAVAVVQVEAEEAAAAAEVEVAEGGAAAAALAVAKWPLPLYRSTANCSGQTSGDCNADIVEQPAQLEALSARYAAHAHAVVSRAAKAGRPFFLYVGFAHVHVPQFCAVGRANSTGRGPFADALAELDDTVGSTLASLHPAPTLHLAPCTLHPAPCALYPAPCTLHPVPCTLRPAPAPCTLRCDAGGQHPRLPREQQRAQQHARPHDGRQWPLAGLASSPPSPAPPPSPFTPTPSPSPSPPPLALIFSLALILSPRFYRLYSQWRSSSWLSCITLAGQVRAHRLPRPLCGHVAAAAWRRVLRQDDALGGGASRARDRLVAWPHRHRLGAPRPRLQP
jgi:hypothetical protein